MPVSDLDIQRTAQLWMQQHGDNALAKAREMAEKMRRRGDNEDADVWLRFIAAIGELGTPPTDARHQPGLRRPPSKAILAFSAASIFRLVLVVTIRSV